MTRAQEERSQRNKTERPIAPVEAGRSRRTEEYFRHLVEDINDVLFALREDGTIEYISPALTALSGYLPEEVFGHSFTEFVHPDDLAEVVGSFQRVVAGAVEPSEFRVLHKDGSVRWVRSSSRYAWMQDDVRVTCGVLTDITERRRAEQLLRENEARFRTLSETTAAITFIHRDEKLLYVNPAGTTVTGYSNEELLGRNFWHLIHPSMREAAQARAWQRLRGAVLPDRTEVKIVTKSGEERWVDFTAAMIDYEGEPAVMGTAFDITERKRAHEAMRASENRFRALIEHSSDLVTLMDENGVIRYVSANVHQMLGWNDRELIGRNAFDAVHPEDVEALGAVFRDLVRQPGKTVVRVYRYRHKNGSWRWMEGVGTNVRGDIEGGVVIINNRDVTDRHRAEEEARQRQAELAHVLRLHVVNEMASVLAHEINQPLAAIVNYARGSLLRLDRGDTLLQIKQALEEIAGQGLRVGEIVRSLKRFVRKEPPQEAVIDLNQLVEDVLHLVESEAHSLGVALHCGLADHLPSIRGDAVQLEQVILNLLRNGIEALQGVGSGGAISVETGCHDESMVTVAVVDTGVGLPEGEAEKVFEPFFTTKPKGLGMGLSIARTIVEAHGGCIRAEANEHGSGTTFRLTFPIASPS